MPKKTRYVEDLPLFPKLPPAQDITDIPASWETNGIFSDHFIRTRLKDIKELWPEEEFAKSLYDDISARWKKKYLGLAKGNEEVTKRELVRRSS